MKNQHPSRPHITEITRRSFLNRSALGAAGVALSGGSLASMARPLIAAQQGPRSRVVVARHPKVIDETGKIQQPMLQDMLNRAMVSLTGQGTVADAWRSMFTTEDVVGLKINLNSVRYLRGTDFLAHFPAMTSAIIDSLTSAGLNRGNMVIWERSEEELQTAGYKIQRDAGSVRVLGTREARRASGGGLGFSDSSFPVGPKRSRVASILTDVCTAVINMPVLKEHRISGLTGALKNHYGSIDNPRDYHANDACSPGIAEVNQIPVIRNKERLIIADALLCVYEGGPQWQRGKFTPLGTIVVGSDPVAVDTVLLSLLDRERTARDLPPVATRARHIQLAEELGLGVSSLKKIDVVSI